MESCGELGLDEADVWIQDETSFLKDSDRFYRGILHVLQNEAIRLILIICLVLMEQLLYLKKMLFSLYINYLIIFTIN